MLKSFSETILPALLLFGIPYAIGFFYLNAYFEYFGMSLSETEMTEREVFVAAFSAVVAIWKNDLVAHLYYIYGTCFGLILILTIVEWTKRKFPSNSERFYRNLARYRKLFGVMSFGVLGLLSVWAISLANDSGELAAQSGWKTFPFVTVVKSSELDASQGSANDPKHELLPSIGFYQLIYASANQVFILWHRDVNSTAIVYRVPRSDAFIFLSFMSWSKV